MKVLAAILANPRTFGPVDPPRTGVARAIYDGLRSLKDSTGDFPFSDETAGVDEVQFINTFSPVIDGGHYSLTITLAGGLAFTTANILFSAGASAVQIAVDRAATGVVPGYAAGDIAITGGPLTDDVLTLTFSGASVGFADHDVTVINNVDLTGEEGGVGDVTVDTDGVPGRRGWGVLQALGLLDYPELYSFGGEFVPEQVVYHASGDGHQFPHGLDKDTVRALVLETSIEEGNDAIYTALVAGLGL